jgi:hypothetical protein
MMVSLRQRRVRGALFSRTRCARITSARGSRRRPAEPHSDTVSSSLNSRKSGPAPGLKPGLTGHYGEASDDSPGARVVTTEKKRSITLLHGRSYWARQRGRSEATDPSFVA